MADTKISGLTAVVTPALTDELPMNQGGVSKKFTLAQLGAFLNARINAASGAAGEYKTLQKLAADSATNSTVTPAVVMTTTGVGAGTWQFEYNVLFQSAALTTGIFLSVNHTGTVSTFSMHSDFVSTGGTAATGIHDGIATVQAAGLHEGHAERAINTASKATAGVATINANQYMVVRGIIVVTATGSLELKLGSEIAASAIKAMANSTLELTKIG